MADVDLLKDTEQLRKDAEVLDAWADCGESAGGKMDVIRRAAAALREIAAIYAYGLDVGAELGITDMASAAPLRA